MERNSSADLYYNRAFMTKVNEFKMTIQPNTYSMVAIDIEHFRLFNKLYGREAGDKLIDYIMDCLKQTAGQHAGVAGYMGGDNFAILMPDQPLLIQTLQEKITTGVKQWNNAIGFQPMIGIYPIDDISVSSEMIYDRATLALSQVPGKRKQQH